MDFIRQLTESLDVMANNVARSVRAAQLAEAAGAPTQVDFDRFKKRITMIDERLEFLDHSFGKDSQFVLLVKKLGGDEKDIERVRKAFAAFEDSIRDLDMSVSITYEGDDNA